MDVIDHEVAEGAAPRQVGDAWDTLDDVLQLLVRAASVVMLIRCADDVEEHHRYGGEIACDLLTSAKEKVGVAQEQVRPGTRPRSDA